MASLYLRVAWRGQRDEQVPASFSASFAALAHTESVRQPGRFWKRAC